MAKLTKTIYLTYTPASPGNPGDPGSPAMPGYWTSVCNNTTPSSCITLLQPVYGPCPSSGGSLSVGGGQCVVDYMYVTSCSSNAVTTCSSVYVPPVAARPPVPATPPTPAQLSQAFNEGWNASAQSALGLLPGKAIVFKIGTGTRSVLAGLAVEQWVPVFSSLPFGIIFEGATGAANIYENNVRSTSLGSFWSDKEFLIGRSKDNFIVYMNYTDRITITRRLSPAPANVPVHFFALQYRGGDVVIS